MAKLSLSNVRILPPRQNSIPSSPPEKIFLEDDVQKMFSLFYSIGVGKGVNFTAGRLEDIETIRRMKRQYERLTGAVVEMRSRSLSVWLRKCEAEHVRFNPWLLQTI
jgi:hypothetical protein